MSHAIFPSPQTPSAGTCSGIVSRVDLELLIVPQGSVLNAQMEVIGARVAVTHEAWTWNPSATQPRYDG